MSPHHIRAILSARSIRAITLTPAAMELIAQAPPPIAAPRVKTTIPPADAALRKPLRNGLRRTCSGWNHRTHLHHD